MRVAELFGPTIQGEGPLQGRLATFVRTSGCDLKCTWCDTPFTWDWSRFDRNAESHSATVGDVVEAIETKPAPCVVITGGEPLIQHRDVQRLVDRLLAGDIVREVWIETNARHSPVRNAGHVCSPKLANAGDPDAINWATLGEHARAGSHLKMVVTGPDELDDVRRVAARAGFDRTKVWVMPEGRTSVEVLAGMRRIADPVIDYGFNLSSRLHTLIWEDERER